MRPALGATAAVAPPGIPLLRGRLHQACAVLAVPAAIAIARVGRTPLARRAGRSYGVALVTLFTISASYHRGRWSPGTRRLLKRADHVAIFVFTGVSYLPLAVVLPRRVRVCFLAFLGTVVALGSTVKAARVDVAGGIADALYVVVGWSGLLVMPWVVRRLGPGQLALLFSGGVVTSAGAVVLVRRRPDPAPAVFGYHEVGHLVILVGTVLHYALDRALLAEA